MIRGYPGRASVPAGGRLALHVATDAPRFRVSFYRCGERLVPMGKSNWLEGALAADGGPAHDWRWPAYAFDVDASWPSGVYVAHLEEPHGAPLRLGADSGAALFVVRGDRGSPLLYRIPLATYHAYNATGGGCFYDGPVRSLDPPGSRVTLLRPGGGIGGATFGAVDFYDESSPRQTFAHWDARFIAWLEHNGFAADYCTDFDIHDDASLLAVRRMLLSVGHDEYWSEPMRDAVEGFVARGGNAAFFGANVCWWRIHVIDSGSAIVCHQGGPHGALDHWWAPSGVNRPEDRLTGVSYRHGGGWWDGPRATDGFEVQDAAHWALGGTGLRNGERFGAGTTPPLVGYECDGAPLEEEPATGRLALAANASQCGTPPSFHVLAVGRLTHEWQELPYRELHPDRGGIHSATMGLYTNGGTVFTAGTTDWAQVLHDPIVDRITRNVVERLSR